MPLTSLLASSAISFICWLFVQGFTLRKSGQTLGKKMVGIRIADLDGGVPDFARLVVLRYLFVGAVLPIPLVGPYFRLIDILFIFRADRRCIHDLIAGTMVVKVGPNKFSAEDVDPALML